MSARVPYCVAMGCDSLPPGEHLQRHLQPGSTGPEHMAELLAAYDKARDAEVLREAAQRIRDHDYDPGEIGPLHLAYQDAADLIAPDKETPSA